MKKKQGFTLIELLVVVAIIGILASVVLAALNSARVKAKDVKVKGQLSNIRAAAQMYYNVNGHYGPSGGTTNLCQPQAGMFASSDLGELAKSANYPVDANTIVCYSNGTAFAVQDDLSTPNKYWCVDSDGASKEELSALTAGVTRCP